MPTPPHAMLAEIQEQPTVLARLLTEQAAAIDAVGEALRRRNPALVVFVARDTSHNAAMPTLTFAFGDAPGDLAADVRLPEALVPAAAAPAVHLFACYLSVARGLNPDAPRGLRKVTVTW